MDGGACKKTMGRRKIEIKKIDKKPNLQVTFSKRRRGLFRKASELSILCGAEIAILVKSPAEKIFGFGHPSVETVLDRFQTGENLGTSYSREEDSSKRMYAEAVRRLDLEKETEKRMKEKEREFWWANDDVLESMELHELEEYMEALEGLRDNVFRRLEEVEKLKLMEDSSDLLASQYCRGFPVDQFNDQDFDGAGRSLFDGVSVEAAPAEIGKDGGSGSSSSPTDQGFVGFQDFCYLECPDAFYI